MACHLDLVDEVAQFQFVRSVERIETPCLAPVWKRRAVSTRRRS